MTVAITRAPSSSVIGNGATSPAGRISTPPARTVTPPVKLVATRFSLASNIAFSIATVPSPAISQFIAKYGFAEASPANVSVVDAGTTMSPAYSTVEPGAALTTGVPSPDVTVVQLGTDAGAWNTPPPLTFIRTVL